MEQCPCGSNKNYHQCCGLYINNQAILKTPEALMRSRYTAYSLANIAYITKTMQGKQRYLVRIERDSIKRERCKR